MWEMQIKVLTPGLITATDREWKSVRTSDGRAYRYATEGEAQTMLDRCYPDMLREYKRVVPA